MPGFSPGGGQQPAELQSQIYACSSDNATAATTTTTNGFAVHGAFTGHHASTTVTATLLSAKTEMDTSTDHNSSIVKISAVASSVVARNACIRLTEKLLGASQQRCVSTFSPTCGRADTLIASAQDLIPRTVPFAITTCQVNPAVNLVGVAFGAQDVAHSTGTCPTSLAFVSDGILHGVGNTNSRPHLRVPRRSTTQQTVRTAMCTVSLTTPDPMVALAQRGGEGANSPRTSAMALACATGTVPIFGGGKLKPSSGGGQIDATMQLRSFHGEPSAMQLNVAAEQQRG